MRLAALLGPDLQALRADPDAIAAAFAEFHPEDVAELVEDLPDSELASLLEVLPSDVGADIIERLDADRQQIVMDALGVTAAAALLGEMDPDDRTDFVGELEEAQRNTLLTELAKTDADAAEETHELLAFEPETAGGLMTTEYVGLPPGTKAWEAIEELRRIAREDDAETIYVIYVIAQGDRLLGVVSLRDLILSDPGQALEDIMTENVVAIRAGDDQEEVARVFARYDLTAIPVVDERFTMLGLVTVDDVVDVVIDEATEDAQMMGGVVPLEDSYFQTRLFEMIWKRGAWLVVLFLGQLLTATVMEANQSALDAARSLAIFIPLIISSGGNAGSQSSTLIIRAMAVGEATPRDWLRVLGRELAIGLSLGLLLSLMGFGRAFLSGGEVEALSLAWVVSASILAVVTLSTIIGSLLPMLIQRLGLDPAVSSTPFIASVVDVLGLLVYFGLATWILSAV
ncbi:MAG: magnesium transporter [Myxococcota bacterium]